MTKGDRLKGRQPQIFLQRFAYENSNFLITGHSFDRGLLNVECRDQRKGESPDLSQINHMVMAAGEMEDLDSADRLATLTEEALHRRGYRSDINKMLMSLS